MVMRREATRRARPLAEGRWFWRRLYAFTVTGALFWLLRGAVRATPPERLPETANGLMTLMALILVLYLVAPTAQQLAAVAANLRLRLAVRGRP